MHADALQLRFNRVAVTSFFGENNAYEAYIIKAVWLYWEWGLTVKWSVDGSNFHNDNLTVTCLCFSSIRQSTEGGW